MILPNNLNFLFDLLNSHHLDGYIVPMEDNHLDEFVADSENQVNFLSGFTGTAGELLITPKQKGLFTDSRYFNMAPEQLKKTDFELIKDDEVEIENYFAKNLSKKVGIPIEKVSHFKFKKYKKLFDKKKIELVPMDDLVKKLPGFDEKHKRKFKLKVKLNDNNKINVLQKLLKKLGNDSLIITDLDTIAWATSYRGADIENNVVFYGYLFITKDTATLFTDNMDELDETIRIKPYNEFENVLRKLNNHKVLISNQINEYLYRLISKKSVSIKFTDLVKDLQSDMNNSQIQIYKDALLKDSVALIELFDYITKNDLTEVEIEEKLIAIKQHKFPNSFIKPSFITVASINSADLHHSNSKDKKFTTGDMILIDSGSHYQIGATDVTRTIVKGKVENQNQKLHYTLVLKGVIKNYLENNIKTGAQVDKNSRQFLKEKGLDYDSATGHGVGIIVHQSPPRISEHGGDIENNKIFTIEPGYYHDKAKDKYGIRIEDMATVKNGKIFNLTFIPYHLDLIDLSLLSQMEIDYLNWYNSKIREFLKDQISTDNSYFLENTRKLVMNK